MLRFTGEVEDCKAYIWARVTCRRLGVRDNVRFCVDTGAQGTCLFQDDAIRIGVDIRSLERLEDKVNGIGGSADECLLEGVELRFVSDDGRAVIDRHPILPIIIQHKSKLERTVEFFRVWFLGRKQVRMVLPSILGFDFLRRCRISFSENEVYLEIREKSLRKVLPQHVSGP